ncbi:MAG: hypothetical protein JWP52_1138 [Rhizobacter sp.]|jgi:phosphoserine phosphatase|nr:hypothetical protein [Rhizobacter sp.]
MADDKTQTGGQDRERIDVHEDYELRDWAKKFNVTPEQVKDAVAAVGDRAADVEMHLKGSRSTSNEERVHDNAR